MANVLIVGKDLPEAEGLLKSFELNGHKIFTTSSAEMDSDNIATFSWNRTSSISARALLVQAELKLVQIDRVLIVFDSPFYASKFVADRIEDSTQSIENMISGYVYFCQTLLKRLQQKQNKVTVGFYLKSSITRAILPGLKNVNQNPCSNFVATAQGAFVSLAENFASSYYQLPNVSVFLCQNDYQNSLYFSNDRDVSEWLVSYFDSIDELKSRQNIKQSISWVKAGSKLNSGFSFFK